MAFKRVTPCISRLRRLYHALLSFSDFVRTAKICLGTALYIYYFIIQHIDTLPKYGKKTFDVRKST